LKRNEDKSFTLIELLIVVAIIAILAAIAIPNFMEAQTRSKISRVKADMRSLANAIESYTVDHNRYPVKTNSPDNYPEGYVRYRLTTITTPIAYITSLPGDTFTDLNVGYGARPGDRPSFVYLLYKYHPWDYYYLIDAGFRLCFSSPSITWVLISQGPVKWDTNYIIWIPYDPTNGTVSQGIIVRSGP
jgi:type II secretion system protein G